MAPTGKFLLRVCLQRIPLGVATKMKFKVQKGREGGGEGVGRREDCMSGGKKERERDETKTCGPKETGEIRWMTGLICAMAPWPFVCFTFQTSGFFSLYNPTDPPPTDVTIG